jgi:hypothetical protein
MLHFTKKRALVVGVVASLALAAGAYAYFTSTGTGSGSATVGTSTAWTITNNGTTGPALTPGGLTEQTMAYSVTNPSTGQQNLAKVTVSVANANGSAWDGPGSCSAADFSVNGAAAGATYDDLENAGNLAPGAVVNNTVTLKMVDTGANQDDCKAASVPLYLAAS